MKAFILAKGLGIRISQKTTVHSKPNDRDQRSVTDNIRPLPWSAVSRIPFVPITWNASPNAAGMTINNKSALEWMTTGLDYVPESATLGHHRWQTGHPMRQFQPIFGLR